MQYKKGEPSDGGHTTHPKFMPKSHKPLPQSFRFRILALAIGATTLLIVGMLILSHFAWTGLFDAFAWVSHTREVEQQIERLIANLSAAETGQRGFLLTGHEVYLGPYRAALPSIPDCVDRLRHLTADNARQQAHLADLDPLIQERLSRMATTISLETSGHHDQAVAFVSTGRGLALMDRIRPIIDAMLREEERLLQIREASLKQRARTNRMITVVGSSVYVALLGFIGLLLWRLRSARTFLTVCAWSKTVEYEGKWITFEEYLKKRFGIDTSHGLSPTEAEKFLRDMEEARVAPSVRTG